MDSRPAFGFNELFTHIIGDIAKAVCERNGETRDQQSARSQAAVHTIMGFLPRDVIEAMLAGHCLMFHELMLDSVRDTLRGEIDTMRRATRTNIVAMDKAFGNNLARLECYQNRPSEGRRDMPDEQGAQTAIEARIAEQPPRATARPAAAASENSAVPSRLPPTEAIKIPPQNAVGPSAPPLAGAAVGRTPSPEAIADCRANPAAMAALEAGDPEGFAHAMGIGQPGEAFLTAATGSPFFADRRASCGSPGNSPPPSPAQLSGRRPYRQGRERPGECGGAWLIGAGDARATTVTPTAGNSGTPRR